jgi:hypothetical protein
MLVCELVERIATGIFTIDRDDEKFQVTFRRSITHVADDRQDDFPRRGGMR